MTQVHKTAIIGKNVTLGEDVIIGPYTIIRDHAKIGDRTRIDAHVLIGEMTTLGSDCQIFHAAVVGETNQDLKYNHEPTETIIGDRTVVREFCTIHRGTDDRWKTVVGSNCLLMAYVHIAHDVIVGNNVIISNATNIAGHSTIEDHAIIGGLTGIHQFSKIGSHTMVGGGNRVIKDIPPYIVATGEPMRFAGLNIIGLRRRGFSNDTIKELKDAYKLIFNSEYNVSDAMAEIKKTPHCQEVTNILDFIANSERGILR
ncbi:MAG: acyl-ACP--UDP-N-acetylglucosamine O-acyltransferase [Candidatus Marinimicrobia bacterium]|nr:acyl-ACP--UDP-N-acetylglucosamine O-acyltransferase [Candidatus Neomarinimicrobiota bacterium]